MTNPLASPYVRIALAAAGESYIATKILNRFVRPELEEIDEQINNVTAYGITGAVTALAFVVVGVLVGETPQQAAAKGPA